MSNLHLRLITAAIGLPIVIAVVIVGGWPFAIVAGLIAALAGLEFGHGWLLPSLPIRKALPQLLTFVTPGVMVAGAHADERFIAAGLVLAALSAVAGYAPTRMFGPRRPHRVQCGNLLYVGLLASTLVLVRDLENGRDWLLLGLLSTFAVDTGAYAVGQLLGRHPLAPRISPKKTVEGAIGGYVVGVVAVLALNALLDTGESARALLPLALVLPVVSQAGDLFESWMKRRMGVKDASGLLPGHGGFLDRLDSILFAVPALYGVLRLFVL